MTRTLGTKSANDGISLAAGDQASVAFAVWDGAAQERDGKKLVTIWQDLVLEK
jgi:DMSO reductase family type II enzyme heme b subunit